MVKGPIVASNVSSSAALRRKSFAVTPLDTSNNNINNNNNNNNDDDAQQQQTTREVNDALAAWIAHGCGEERDATAHVLDAIQFGLAKEATSSFAHDCDYIKATQHDGFKLAWRVKIVRWMFETGKAFDLTIDTIGCAIAFLDQYLSAASVDKHLMQLLSLVCVFCASKMHEPEPLTLDELSLLCEARYSHNDMCRVESYLLRVVGWQLNPLNAFTFARDVVSALELADADAVVASVVELLTFVAEDYKSVCCTASSTALAAVQRVLGVDSQNAQRAHEIVVAAAAETTEVHAADLVAATALVQRVYATVYSDDASDDESDVTSSPVAVESHPSLSGATTDNVVQPVESATIVTAAPTSPTQRTLFPSASTTTAASYATDDDSTSATDDSTSSSTDATSNSKKRKRTASLSFMH